MKSYSEYLEESREAKPVTFHELVEFMILVKSSLEELNDATAEYLERTKILEQRFDTEFQRIKKNT